ncbi:hypothetical protein N9E09_01875 [bacterium]|jgi:hypothetical protein|nr:hypothetical protein [bacterium]
MLLHQNILIKQYSEDPEYYRDLIYPFIRKSRLEGNDSIRTTNYNPDDPNIETWMCFIEGKLISISAVEQSHYTNDPDVAARVCRYHILKDYRFTHCGLRMADLQIDWARKNKFEILYITHDVNNRAINALYQRKKRMTVESFKQFTNTEWYKNLQLETDFLFKTGDMLQYVYSIRLNNSNFIWQPESKFITRNFDASLIECP